MIESPSGIILTVTLDRLRLPRPVGLAAIEEAKASKATEDFGIKSMMIKL